MRRHQCYYLINVNTMLKRITRLTSTSDANFTEVLRHSSIAFLILVGATGVQFLFDLLLAQRFGATGYGIFYLGFSVLMVLALIGRLGVDRAVVRFIPEYFTRGDKHSARGVVVAAITSSLALTIPVAFVLFVFSETLAVSVFNEPQLALYLKTFAFAVPPFALSYVYSGILKSIKQTGSSLFLERISVYAVGILSVVFLTAYWGLESIVIAFTVACYSTALAGAWLVHKHLRSNKPTLHFSKRRLLIVAGPLLFVMFATQMNGQASVLLLGGLSNSTDVGVFNVALKISMLMTIVLTAITTITATKISELYHSGRTDELSLILSKTSALGALAALPLLLAMVLFPTFLLGLFGQEFTSGYAALTILSIGQYINVAVGATVFALGLTDRERPLAVVVGIGLIVNVGLGLLLIPPYGVVGAAIATGATIAFTNLAMVYLVKRYLGILLLPFAGIKSWLRVALGRR
jgi:O-antigen/teichoic acid export membrane protein